jgi:hypothetical protein
MFKGVDDIANKSISESVNENVMNFIDWGFINAGGYFNNTLPSSGIYGGERARLSLCQNKNYETGQVWQTYHPKLLWESGLNVGSPIPISGVYVNDSFVPLNSGYSIDYNNGYVIFDEAKPKNTVVKMEYSHRWVSVLPSNDIPFFKRLVEDGYRIDTNGFSLGSGSFIPQAENRAFPPIAAVSTYHRNNKPYELGTGQSYNNCDVKINVIAERESDCERIGSILVQQYNKTFFTYNPDQVLSSGAYPLNYNGTLSNSPKTFPQITDVNDNGGYRWKRCYIKDAIGEPTTAYSQEVYVKTITWKTEIINR